MNEPWYIGLDPEQAKKKRAEAIRKSNPFCDAAPEIFGAVAEEDAKNLPQFAEYFAPENDWRRIGPNEQPPIERQYNG